MAMQSRAVDHLTSSCRWSENQGKMACELRIQGEKAVMSSRYTPDTYKTVSIYLCTLRVSRLHCDGADTVVFLKQ